MATRTIICRDHGGRYTYESARGRQPVRCKPDNPCDHARNETPVGPPKGKRGPVLETAQERKEALERAESNGNGQKPDNPSLPLAMAAKAQLAAVGWTVKGKAGSRLAGDGDEEYWAELSASRGAETLLMVWLDGRITEQMYSLNYERPADNGFPPNKLDFNPEELTDRELVERIKGMKVTWWNTLASSTETGVIGNKVSIEHVFDDDSAKRLVKFIDHGGGGFRAFHVGALLKVGGWSV